MYDHFKVSVRKGGISVHVLVFGISHPAGCRMSGSLPHRLLAGSAGVVEHLTAEAPESRQV